MVRSRTCSASPTEPLRSWSDTSTLRLVDRFGRGLLADALDVARLVRDVGDVHVDQVQADLVELGRHVAADRVEEFLAVLVDLLDGQRRHREAQLAEDDLARHALDVVLREIRAGARPRCS